MQVLSKAVALSRQRGSGGSYVGREVAKRLGLLCIDREMLRDAAEYRRLHDSSAQVATADSSWWSRLGQAFAMAGPDSGYVPPSPESVYEGDRFEIEERLIQEIVAEHTAVIVGHGAAQVLRGRAGVLSVFLHAPEPWRIKRVQQIYRLADLRDAQQLVRDSDRDRAKFIQAKGGVSWTDVRGYDLAVDTAAIGLEATVDLIVRAVSARVEGDETGVPSA
jgi:cytidylate kinase